METAREEGTESRGRAEFPRDVGKGFEELRRAVVEDPDVFSLPFLPRDLRSLPRPSDGIFLSEGIF